MTAVPDKFVAEVIAGAMPCLDNFAYACPADAGDQDGYGCVDAVR
jgi:hypothetical protein